MDKYSDGASASQTGLSSSIEPASSLAGSAASIPSALDSWWPIPLPEDSIYCDEADEGAQVGLLALMTGISEGNWCASWMDGLEYSLWRAREDGPTKYGMGQITERQCALLRLLSEEANGWWYFDGGKGARFTRLEAWKAHASAMSARSAETVGLSPQDASAGGAAETPKALRTHLKEASDNG